MGGEKIAQGRYEQRVQNTTVYPYAAYVGISDSTVVGRYSGGSENSNTSSNTAPKRTHEHVYLAIEKVPVKAGFDSNGNARYEMKYDVVRKVKQESD